MVTLNASARGVSMLVNDLLAYTRIGRQAVERVPVNLSNLARASCAELQNSEWPCRSLTFRIEENLIADGDPQLLRLVLDNLLENASKYSRRHSAQTVQVGSKLIRGEQAFFVKDRGVGFPVEFAHKLFQPFERLHAQTEYAGNGIGLANVKRIVEKHGGNVWARANRGYGATFFFTLGQSEGVERGG